MRPRVIVCGATVVLLTLLLEQYGTHASRILFLSPVAGKSHRQFYSCIVTTLAKHGHEMTFVSPYASKEETPRVREVVLPGLDYMTYMPNVFETGRFNFRNISYLTADLCAQGLEDPKVQKLLNETFDMIMMPIGWTDCFLVFQHKLRVPLVLVSPWSLTPPSDSWFGNPTFASYDPNLFIGTEPPLSFGTRVLNVFMNAGLHGLYHWTYSKSTQVSGSRGLLPEDMPPFEAFYRNASLIILNSYRVMETPKAYVPNIIHAGGLHLKPTKPLPQDLEEWMQGTGDDGFIYFSLGSVFKTSYIPATHLLTLVRVFGRLQQRVLMKWNEDHIEGLPPNVRVAKWLPQQDILAHPKVRLFISHGGLHGTMEGLHHGVPILGLPLTADQLNNIEKGTRQGWAIRLDWKDLTEESLMSAIARALNDTRLRDKARHAGDIIRDQPMTPAETVVYWVDYVLRHGGARHLRCPAADMSWFILYNCDVWLALVASVSLVAYALFVMLRCCLRRCFHSKTKKKAD